MGKEIVSAPLSSDKVRSLYNSLSYVYDILTWYEIAPQKKALEVLAKQHGSRVLEVGFGTAKTLTKFAGKVGDAEVYGLDISVGMTKRAKKRVRSRSLSGNVDLILGDAGSSPFQNSVFDIVFSSYVLDLIDTPDILKFLSEFKRLLKRNGRLVLVSLTKGSKWYDSMRFYEWIYSHSPSLLGGCRPVILGPCLHQLGFKNISRELVHAGLLMTTELIWADND